MKTIRLFPIRIKATPDDPDVRVGQLSPGLFDVADEVHISVTFTWHLNWAERAAQNWRHVAPVRIGGPATGEPSGDFVPGMYMKRGYVLANDGKNGSIITGNNDENDGNWITVNGARVKIEKGQSKEEAVRGFIEKKEAERETEPIAVTFSSTGANPSIPAFTQKSLDDHWGGKSDHSGDYPGFTKEQYAERALELVRMPTSESILGYQAMNGAIVRYDKTTNDFVKGFKTGVATLYKPDGGEDYFKRVMKREVETNKS